MKKQAVFAVVIAALSAVLTFGIKYANDWYLGTPKDAVPVVEFEYVPKKDKPAAESFVGTDAAVHTRAKAVKNTYLWSRRMNTKELVESAEGLIDLDGADAEDAAERLDEKYFIAAGSDIKPGTAEPVQIPESGQDEAYKILAEDGETEQINSNLVKVVKKTEDGKDAGPARYYALGKLKDSLPCFFPAGKDGKMVPGALPAENIKLSCYIPYVDVELEAWPRTEAAKAEKQKLIDEYREKRIAAEKEAAERAAREAAARAEAARKAAEEEAARKAAEEAARLAAMMTPEQKAALAEELKAQRFYLEKNHDRYMAYKIANPTKDNYAVVQAVNTNIDRPFYTNVQSTNTGKGILMLVNKYYTLGSGYAPALETLGSGYGSGSLHPAAAAAFRQMVDAAKAEGISLRSVSPFRSYGTQNSLYNGYVSRSGRTAADRYSARPGHSEHQTGLAVDINTADFADNFQNTAEYAWLIKHCAEYGFILRYLPGKEYITGYRYEPWHYRYVGKQTAQALMGSGLTFEEYYAYYLDK